MKFHCTTIKCLECRHERYAVYPEAQDESSLECSKCGKKRSEVVYRHYPDGGSMTLDVSGKEVEVELVKVPQS